MKHTLAALIILAQMASALPTGVPAPKVVYPTPFPSRNPPMQVISGSPPPKPINMKPSAVPTPAPLVK